MKSLMTDEKIYGTKQTQATGTQTTLQAHANANANTSNNVYVPVSYNKQR
jgi:hypothetical protein